MDLPILSFTQYDLVFNVLSFTVACMFASAAFFIAARNSIGERYRLAVTIAALAVGIAGYHYVMIFYNWVASYDLSGMVYVPNGHRFNDAYRYVDWVLTVPLLMVELVAVLGLSKSESRSLLTRLIIAAALMTGLGYPGEISSDNMVRFIFGVLGTLPFLYIVYVLWFEMSGALERQSERIRVLYRNIRLLTLAAWGFYPMAYMAPLFLTSSASGEVILQVGYSMADILAKCGYGIIIFSIARLKTEADRTASRPRPKGPQVPTPGSVRPGVAR
ncbi:MAG TPA: bacteriorhodopsin-like [Calditrichia bacterium]|nr:bacteriorhodopsin-like [Calditrichia bacterium]